MRRTFALLAITALGTIGALGACSTSTSDRASTDLACYVGDWSGTDAAMRTMLGVSKQPDANVSGSVVLTLRGDGGFAYAFDQLSTDRNARGEITEITMDGTVSGTYAAAGDALEFTLLSSNVTVAVDGKQQQADIKLGTNDKGNGEIGQSPYSCKGDLLTITGANDGKITTWGRL